jgi:hypothetical protein
MYVYKVWITLDRPVDKLIFHLEYLRYASLPHPQKKFFMLYNRRLPAEYAAKS